MQALVPHGQPIAVGNQVQQPVPLQPLLARYNQAQQQLDLGMDMYVKLFCEALYAVAHHQSHASTHYTSVSTHQHREIRNGRPYRGSTVDIIRDYPALRDAISQHGIAARYGVDVSTMRPAAEPLAQFVFAHQGKFQAAWTSTGEGILSEVIPIRSRPESVQVKLLWPDSSMGL